MTNKEGEVLVRMDEGSANVVGGLVEKEVGCGNTMNLPTESGAFDFLRHGLFCKAMFATAELNDSQWKQQCVAMGGFVERCPVFGTTSTGESKGEHEKLKKLVELQTEIVTTLTYSSLGNFNTVSGSKLDKS